jgi:hypothetical protein
MNNHRLSTQIIATATVILSVLFICCTPRSALAGLMAVVTANNDFTIDERPVGKEVLLPSPVALKIGSLVDKAYSQFKDKPSKRRYFPRNSFFGPIFRITAPGKRELYVFRRTGPMGADFFFFILFDPMTKRITQNPPCIYAKWMKRDDWGAELRKPLLSFEDVDGDGQQEYLVQERVHNGTMYNAIVYHYYHVSSDLDLRPILAVETRLLDLFTEEQGGVITRTVQTLGKGKIRLDVSLDCKKQPLHRELGSVVLRSPKPGSPFAIVERTVLDSAYASALVTASEEDEAKFVVEGYGLYY